ncbi:hypothetical protein D3C81_1839970 [compost metagenome]
MPRRVQHLQRAIAQIQHITVLDKPGRRRGFDPVLGVAQRAIRVRFEHVVANESTAQVVFAIRRRKDVRFGAMHQSFGEFMMAGDVVEVAMTGHCHQWPLGNPRQLFAQADQS